MNDQTGQVRCVSGYTYAQRPVSFIFSGQNYQVERVITEKRFPDGKQFLVMTESGQAFELVFTELTGEWQILLLPIDHLDSQGDESDF